MRRLLIPIILAAGLLPAPAYADTYTITLAESLFKGDGDASGGDVSGGGGFSGRLMVFFITEPGGRWSRRAPISGPFFSKPQPIASVEVKDLMPGASIVVESWESSFPDDLDSLDGSWNAHRRQGPKFASGNERSTYRSHLFRHISPPRDERPSTPIPQDASS